MYEGQSITNRQDYSLNSPTYVKIIFFVTVELFNHIFLKRVSAQVFHYIIWSKLWRVPSNIPIKYNLLCLYYIRIVRVILCLCLPPCDLATFLDTNSPNVVPHKSVETNLEIRFSDIA